MALTFFHEKNCPECGSRIDAGRNTCPKCRSSLDDPGAKRFKNMLPLGTFREIALFVVGWLGFQVLGFIVSFIQIALAQGVLIGAGLTGGSLSQAIQDYASSVEGTAFLNYATYIVLFLVLLAIISPEIRRIASTFAKWRNVLWGLLGGIALIVVSMLWGMVVSAFDGGTSINQETVVSIVDASPLFAVVVLGFIGPICEEITYRLGLFNLGMRIHPAVAYLLASVVFGLIHMKDFSSLNEWLNFPDYLFAGLILSFVYHRFGFEGSVAAHVLNNLIAVISALIV